MTSPPLVQVLVPRPIQHPFTYKVPPHLVGRVHPGDLVVVPLGGGQTLGCVWGEPPPTSSKTYKIRALLAHLPRLPNLPSSLRSLLNKLSMYYHAPLGEVLRLALPSVTLHKVMTLTEEGENLLLPPPLFSHVRELLQASPTPKDAIPFSISKKEWETWETSKWVKQHSLPDLTAPLFRITTTRPPILKDRRRVSVRCHHYLHEHQQSTFNQLIEAQITPQKSALKKALRSLLEGEAIEIEISTPLSSSPTLTREDDHTSEGDALTLTAEQVEVISQIESGASDQTFLLHGVTGSGKTEVYLEVIERVLARGESALVLVPEIGLTPQTIRRFKRRLSAPIYPWHSQLSPLKKGQIWRAVSEGTPCVLIGARSALFTPISPLGVIIVDESHDSSYKQGDGVRYHGRDMSVMRGKLENCKVILGSATPSLESLHNAHTKKYTLLQLHERPQNAQLPQVRVIDLKTARTAHRDAPAFSMTLIEALKVRIQRQEQSILFLNRRGFSHSVRCLTCGFLFKCPHCEITLPWHKKKERLQCHHCEFSAPLPHHCPDCQSTDSYMPIGRGTERIEDQLRAVFPHAKVYRLDRDSDLKPLELESKMRSGEIDILIGTQMVTKGHDFPRVTLVGVIDADGGLDLPDFRAAERSYQLLSQVAGRAGRSTLLGEVLIQTYRPHEEVLQSALTHDYIRFSVHELQLRQTISYPPYGYMITLRIESEHLSALHQAIDQVRHHLQGCSPHIQVRGPNPAPLEQVRRRRRWLILLRSPHRGILHKQTKYLCDQIRHDLDSKVSLIVDVDPLDFL